MCSSNMEYFVAGAEGSGLGSFWLSGAGVEGQGGECKMSKIGPVSVQILLRHPNQIISLHRVCGMSTFSPFSLQNLFGN